MDDIAVRVADPDLAQGVQRLLDAGRRTSTPAITADTTLLVTDVVPDRVEVATVVVTADGGPDAPLWRAAAAAGVEQVVALPSAAPLLAARLARRNRQPPGGVIRVVGTRGGCGASTLAIGVAVAAADDGAVALVDADPAAGGIDTALGLDGDAGLRWPDLAGLRGRVPPSSLIPRLPHAKGVHVLSHSRPPTGVGEAWPAVLACLTAGCRTVVADVPRYLVADLAVPEARSVDVLVTPAEVIAIATARRLIDSGVVTAAPVIAVPRSRGPLPVAAVADALAGEQIIEVPRCAAVTGSMDFGDVADAVTARPFRRACRRLLDSVAGTR